MDATCKDGSEYDPEIGAGSELGTHDGTEYRTQTCDVKELDHVGFPCRHCNIVNAVGHTLGRHFTVGISPEKTLNEFSVEHIAQDQDYQSYHEC